MRDLRRSASEAEGYAGKKGGQDIPRRNQKQQKNESKGKFEAALALPNPQDKSSADVSNPLRITLFSSSLAAAQSSNFMLKSAPLLELTTSDRASPQVTHSSANTKTSEISHISKKIGQISQDFLDKGSSEGQSSQSDEEINNSDGEGEEEDEELSSNSKNDDCNSKKNQEDTHKIQKGQKQKSSHKDNHNATSSQGIEKQSKTSGRWTKEEHEKFEEGLQLFGRNWKRVEDHIGTRTGAQIRSHAQKFYNRLEKEQTGNQSVSDKSRELLDIMNSPAFHAASTPNNYLPPNPPKLSKTISSQSTNKKKTKPQAPQINDTPMQPHYPEEQDKIPPFLHDPNALQFQSNTHSNNIPVSNVSAEEPFYYHHQDPVVMARTISKNCQDSCRRKISDDFDVVKLLAQSLNKQPNHQQQLQQHQQQHSPLIPQQFLPQIDSHFLPPAQQALDWNKLYEEYSLFDKDDSNDSNDCSEGNQLRQFYEQALKNPLYNPQHQQFLSQKFSKSLQQPQETLPSFSSSAQPAPPTPPVPVMTNNSNNYNRYNIEDKDSEEVIDRFFKTIQEQSGNNNDNSFFLERNLADITEPKQYDLGVLGQQDQSSNSLNYRNEAFVPNPAQQKARSRFGSFKLHDEENESSNLKYQNLRKASIDDHEFKKKFKLNDGSVGHLSANQSTSKHSSENIITN